MTNLQKSRSSMEEQYKAKLTRPRIVVGLGTCGIAAGGNKVMAAIKKEVADRKLDVDVDFTSCIGMCFAEPVIEISLPGSSSVVYGGVFPDNVGKLIEGHLINKTPLTDMSEIQIPGDAKPYDGIPVMEKAGYYPSRCVPSRASGENQPD